MIPKEDRDRRYAEALVAAFEEYAEVEKLARTLKVRLTGLQMTIRGLCLLAGEGLPNDLQPGNLTTIITKQDREQRRTIRP